jgi:hypothetical protein
VFGASCILFSTVGFVNAFGVFEQYYAETFLRDKSLSAISWLGSFNVFCMFGGALVSGNLNDIYGPNVIQPRTSKWLRAHSFSGFSVREPSWHYWAYL